MTRKRKMKESELLENIYISIKRIEEIKKLVSESQVDDVLSHVENILKFLPGPMTTQKLTGLDEDNIDIYVETAYNAFLDQFLQLFNQNFPFRNNHIYESIKKLFELDDPKCFKTNFEKLVGSLHSNTIAKAQLLQIVLESQGLIAYIFSNCYIFKINEEDVKTFATLLTSLPNRIANFSQRDTPDFFITGSFCKFLLFKILMIIEFIVQFIKREPKVEPFIKLEPLSILTSKVLMNFNDNLNSEGIKIFIEIIGYSTNKHSDIMKLYQRIFHKIFVKFDRPVVDIFGKMSLMNIDPKKYLMKYFFGRELITNETWRYVFSTKIPLLTFFSDNYDNLILNLVLYLSSVDSSLLITLYINLLSVWADTNSINHTSVEQQSYITKLIVLITNALKNIGLSDFERQKIKEKVFTGIPVHLECPHEIIRVSGMKISELVINFINKEGETSEEGELKFDYNNFKEETQLLVQELQTLADKDLTKYFLTKRKFNVDVKLLLDQLKYQKSENAEYIPIKRQFRSKTVPQKIKNEIEFSELKTASRIKVVDATDFELDSDDDLEPYDVSNDVKISKKSPPAYLRDLRDGLLETEDAEIFALSLQCCQNVVISQLADDDASIGLELLEILIALEQRFYVENFDELLFESCVCITCVYPTFYAEYLCKQIHADMGTYSIARRIFMLDVLKQAARNLSTIKKETFENKTIRQEELHSAQEVITKRLENKTRYFTKHKMQVLESVNHFAQVVGHFFFPLLYGYNNNKLLKSDKDFILLIHFIETLAVIMCAAQNCTVISKMAKEAFQFSWFLRFHVEVKVRMAILSLIASAVLAVPKDILIGEFLNELFEIRLWLADLLSPNITRGDPNLECRNLAASVIILTENILKMDVDIS